MGRDERRADIEKVWRESLEKWNKWKDKRDFKADLSARGQPEHQVGKYHCMSADRKVKIPDHLNVSRPESCLICTETAEEPILELIQENSYHWLFGISLVAQGF